jgi:hypothetical protein
MPAEQRLPIEVQMKSCIDMHLRFFKFGWRLRFTFVFIRSGHWGFGFLWIFQYIDQQIIISYLGIRSGFVFTDKRYGRVRVGGSRFRLIGPKFDQLWLWIKLFNIYLRNFGRPRLLGLRWFFTKRLSHRPAAIPLGMLSMAALSSVRSLIALAIAKGPRQNGLREKKCLTLVRSWTESFAQSETMVYSYLW